jgi:WD40 repeat protein
MQWKLGHTDTVQQAKFNHTGNLIATGSMDATVKIWDVNDGKLITSLEGPSEEIRFIDWH